MNSPSSELRYHQYLPTKYVRSPSSLVEAVRVRAGDGNFQIEVCRSRKAGVQRIDPIVDAAQYVLYQLE
jgi:hypothetical protein